MREHEKIETKREREPRVEDEREPRIAVKSGVRAGAGTWKLGNKVWTDDWLAPV